MSIWQFNETVSRRLLAWNVVNIVVGVALLPFGRYWRGLGSQNIGWGLINIAIAVGGRYFAERRLAQLPQPDAPATTKQEASSLRRILWINAGLDVLYMLGGLRLAGTRGRNDARWRGVGQGIAIQGMLLFIFDVIHALLVPDN